MKAEEERETDLTETRKDYSDLVAEKDGKVLGIRIRHCSPKKQIEMDIGKT